MPSVLHTLREVEESGRAMLAQLDTTDYLPGRSWTPTKRSGDLLGDAQSVGGLVYDLRVIEDEGDGEHLNGGPCGPVVILQARMILTFSFPVIASGDTDETWSLAGDAAEHAIRALCSPPWRSRGPRIPRRRWAVEGAEVGVSEAPPGARWLVTTVEIACPIWLQLEPAEAQPPGALPVVRASVDGDPTSGGVLHAIATYVSGSLPVEYAYAWDTSPVEADTWTLGVATTEDWTQDDDTELLDRRVRITPSNATGAGDAATSLVVRGLGDAAEPPINTVAPLLSGMSGGGAAVGDSLALSDGTWDPVATSYTKQYTRGGIDISGATSSPYLVVAGDAGATIGGYVYGINDDGTSVLPGTASNPQVIRPYWTAAPTIASGAEPWPGGDVNVDDDGTVAGATSSSRVWTLNGTTTGVTASLYNPVVADIGQALRRAGIASNSGGDATGTSTSDPLTIVRVAGVDRPSTVGPYPECQGIAVGNAGTAVVECTLDSVANPSGWVAAVLVEVSGTDRTGVGIRVNHNGTPANDTVDVLMYDGAGPPIINNLTPIATPGISSGTPYVIVADWNGVGGSTVDGNPARLLVSVGPRGGSASTSQVNIPASGTPAGTLNLSLFRQTSGWSATVRPCAGSANAVVLNSSIGAAAAAALIALPRGAVQSLFGSDIGRIDCAATTTAPGVTISSAAGLDCTGGTAVLQAGTGNLTSGGQNVAV